MAEPWFIWNNVDSRSMGVVISAYPARERGRERVTTVTVPGRSGVLTLPEGEDDPVLDAVELRMNCYLRPGADVRAVLKWLRGSGQLVLGNDPGFCREGRLVETVSLLALEGDSGWQSFDLVWQAQPWRLTWPRDSAGRSVTSGERVYNPGDLRIPAVITMKGSFSGSITVGSNTVTLTDIEGGILLDWESCDCYLLDSDGNPAALAGSCAAGTRQYLEEGYTTVSWTVTEGSVDSVSLALNWRFC